MGLEEHKGRSMKFLQVRNAGCISLAALHNPKPSAWDVPRAAVPRKTGTLPLSFSADFE